MPRPKPLRTLVWNSARASSSGAGLFAGMQIGVRILQLEAARRIADRQGYVDIISIRPQGRWTAHLALNSPLADMVSTSCCISDQFILNDHRPVAVRPKSGARAKQPIQHQATDCHVEVCDPGVTVTSSRPAVGLRDKTLLTLERLDQSCAICCAGPIVRGTRGALRPTLLHPMRTASRLLEGDVSIWDDAPPQLKGDTSVQRRTGRA